MYKAKNQVPRAWQRLNNVALSLDQINTIVTTATASTKVFAIALGEAQKTFIAEHNIVKGVWVPKENKA